MRISLIVGSLIAAALITTAFADERKIIEDSNARLAQAILKGESTKAFYASSATLLPDHGEIVRGSDAIAGYWAEFSKEANTLEIKTMEVMSLGPEALQEIGTYAFASKDMAGEGKYLVVWCKHGNDWKVESDIWNTNK